METKIKSILENLDMEETEVLLQTVPQFKLNKRILRRIKKSTLAKAGLETKTSGLSLKWTACLAALALIAFSFWGIGLDRVGAAMRRVFSFIPGYAIVENNESITYVLKEGTSAENDRALLVLNNALATDKTLELFFRLTDKRYLGQDILPPKTELEARHQARISLYANENKYSKYSGHSGSDGVNTSSLLVYEVKPTDLGEEIVYRLELEDYDLGLDFSLQDYDTFASLEEIGPTAYHNDISITAVPTFSQDQVTVDLYPINKSCYSIDAFAATYNNAYLADLENNLHLATGQGPRAYRQPDSHFGPNTRFIFPLEPGDQDLELKIPFLIVQSDEKADVSLSLPPWGESLRVNKRLEFKDGAMIIEEIKRSDSRHIGEEGELELKIAYESKDPRLTFLDAHFIFTNLWGSIFGSSTWQVSDQGIVQTIYLELTEKQGDRVKLRVQNPRYRLQDEYVLDLGR